MTIKSKKYRLLIKRTGCNLCAACEKYLPDFISKHNGSIEVDEWALKDPVSADVIDQAILSCPLGAIGIERIK